MELKSIHISRNMYYLGFYDSLGSSLCLAAADMCDTLCLNGPTYVSTR